MTEGYWFAVLFLDRSRETQKDCGNSFAFLFNHPNDIL
jgi:hypothetical protein